MHVNVDGSLNFLFCDKGQSYSCGRVYAELMLDTFPSRLVYKKVLSVEFYSQSIKQRRNYTFSILDDIGTD